MFYSIFPQYDATLYEQFPNRNTGVDQILELVKVAINSKDAMGTIWENTFNSRVLIKFDLSEISSSIVSGDIPSNANFHLRLWATETSDLPIDYTIYAYPVSQSWTNGNGNYNDSPQITNGVSWRYRTGLGSSETWGTGSNVDRTFQTTSGGGNWFTGSGYEASQSFSYEFPDIRMNVTDIVNKWLTGDVTNNGLILKRSNTDESGSSVFGSLKFFSKDTHTVFIPRMEITWDDSDLSGTGSIAEVGDDYTIFIPNIRPAYQENTRAKIRIKPRDTYPTRTYSTSSNYAQLRRLPTSSYYSVSDYSTGETIIPFDANSTKISCDSNGNFFYLRMNALLPERYYELKIKVEREGGDIVDIIDDSFLFKVRRNVSSI
jgi:hypothetical protein